MKGTPAYDGNGYYVGTYRLAGSDSQALMQEVNKSYPRYNAEKTYKAIEMLLYQFSEDPENLMGTHGITPYQYWVATQEVVYYFTQSREMANQGSFPGMNEVQKALKEKAEAYMNGSVFPDNSKFVEVRTYASVSGGVQSLVSGHVRQKPKVYFSKQEYKQGMTDEEMSYNINNGGGLSGAEMILADENGEILVNLDTQEPLEWTSNANPARVSLMPGNYRVIEKKAPDGYQKVEAVDFTVRTDGSIFTYGKLLEGDTIVLLDKKLEPEKKLVSIKKVDNKGVMINGASLELWTEGEGAAKIESWFSMAGSAKEFQLKPGTYRLKEKEAPAGHVALQQDIVFTVSESGQVAVTSGEKVTVENSTLVVQNDQKPYIGTYATGKEDNQKDVKTVDHAMTSEGQVMVDDRIDYSGFPEGDYVACATLVSYSGTQEITKAYKEFTVGSDGRGSVLVEDLKIPATMLKTPGLQRFTVLERVYRAEDLGADRQPKEGRLPIAEHVVNDDENQTIGVNVYEQVFTFGFTKVDEKNTKLAGARLQIFDEKGQAVPGMVWTSQGADSTPIRVSLKAGKYTLKEIGVPEGYEGLSDKPFEVMADGKIVFEDTQDVATKQVSDGWLVDVKNHPEQPYVNPEGKISTTVKADDSTASETALAEVAEASVGDGVAVVDTIHYTGLVEGKEYDVTGTLYEVKDGVVVGDAKATKTAVLTAGKDGKGDWELDFGTVEGLEVGKSYVVYEKAVSKENLVDADGDKKPESKQEVKHENPADKSQTFIIKETPKKEVIFSKTNLGGEEIAGAKIEIKKDGQTVESWTSKEGESKTVKLAAGTYTFHEEAAPTGYLKVTDFTFTVKEDGTVELGEIASEDAVEWKEGKVVVTDKAKPVDPEQPGYENPAGEIRTTVKANSSTGNETAPAQVSENEAESGVTVTDTISYTGLVGGKTYKVTGSLNLVENGKAVKVVVTATAELKADESGKGSWELDFGTIAGLEEGKSYVVYESARSLERLIDTDYDNIPDTPQNPVHEDPKDPAQTITVVPRNPVYPEGKIKTTVKANNATATSEQKARVTAEEAKTGVHVVDTIAYEGLVGGKDYTVSGTLMEVKAGQPVGAVDTMEATKTADQSGSGSWELDFGTRQDLKPGSSYVVFERVKSVELLIDKDGDGISDQPDEHTHENPEDKAQTFTVKPEEPGGEEPKYENPDGKIRTTVQAGDAVASENAAAEAKASEDGTAVTDTIHYTGLVGGKAYKVTGKLNLIEDGKVVKTVTTATAEFTAEQSGSGSWTLDFGKVKGLEEGKTYVVYESAKSVEKLVDTDYDNEPDAPHSRVHEDPTDKAQTVKVKPDTPQPDEENGKILTTVKANNSVGSADQSAKVSKEEAGQGVKLVDTIHYEGLKGGKVYKVTGKLNQIKDGKVVQTVAEATAEFTADPSGKGSWELDFGTVTGLKAGETYVVFERAISVEKLIDTDGDGVLDKEDVHTHEDPKDKAQTVEVTGASAGKVKGSPKTGDSSQSTPYILMMLSVAAFGTLFFEKRRRIKR
ncbi:VaFE repeat-containing surface-anchored protein [Clostridiaceae bacterium 68-1-5]|uniref:VaFE repeat-containing surface-anchored protein n=1 Tax=Suipraeoptans intestinalis TaxID=2606628 RepID=A0A6N7UZI9_9FIRM|nr:VaFE repeat-containing surface-anchored protein [Suipraeoptans intestinalis]MSR93709.1 VaFE repeat-containing surface-anchored protein [Suipraeoptans intestinalis]